MQNSKRSAQGSSSNSSDHQNPPAMFSDLISRPVHLDAYDGHPFTFLKQREQNDIAGIAAINLIENGERAARQNWQNRQLTNLLRHAQARSKVWRQKLPSGFITHSAIKHLPIQTRDDVAAQLKLEGSLVSSPDGKPMSSYASTGSTGTPVKVFMCPENGYYNSLRSLAQYFINNLSLEENRVQIGPAASTAQLERKSPAVQVTAGWAGSLSAVFRTGANKVITERNDDNALIAELLKDPVGYLVCPSRYVEAFIKARGVEIIKKMGVKLWIHQSDYRDPEAVKALTQIGVKCLSNYSAGEVGPIAFECMACPGHFHVAHTNVIVECDQQRTTSFNGVAVSRLLVTHLHSYATPIIRYDIGDFAELHDQCRCGHEGPTISNIYGRGKHFLRHPDGRLLPFYLSTRLLLDTVDCAECRVVQTGLDTITVELGGREHATPEEEERLRNVIINVTDPAFKVVIKATKNIDWSGNPKRLFFSSLVE